MSEPIIYKGRGTPEMYDDLMDFMNYVFGFNGNEQDFLKLLPKLYKPENDPCHSNYVVTENGKLKAAIGAFDSDLQVGSETLHCRGIGNVAVHPYSRSKGYMKDCMKMAEENMLKDGVDFSILGGQRQRYMYFGYDTIGVAYSIKITPRNMRHVFAGVPFVDLEFHRIASADDALLDAVYALHGTRPVHTVRPREKFFDVAVSWFSKLYAILKDGEVIGYFIGDLQELTLKNIDDFNDVVRNYCAKFGDVSMRVPVWKPELIAAAQKVCEHMEIEGCDHFNIFNYKKVVGAFLKFKAETEKISDGEITVFIHGFAGDCRLKLTVSGGTASVEDYEGECDLELDHFAAMHFFFGLYSPDRANVTPEIRSWLPLPLFTERADDV